MTLRSLTNLELDYSSILETPNFNLKDLTSLRLGEPFGLAQGPVHQRTSLEGARLSPPIVYFRETYLFS